MKVLIIGCNGQLGTELQKTSPDHIEYFAYDKEDINITNESAVLDKVAEIKPDYIINAAAYTAVDKAEQELELADKINHQGVVYLAKAAKANNSFLIQISTDFIFDGSKNTPYQPEDTPNPLGAYGKTKLDGENAVKVLDKFLIIRTAWVYASHGHNFVKTMLRLMQEKPMLKIVYDQIGSPTWAQGLAKVIWLAIEKNLMGVHHWTDAGITSWYDFAVAIQEHAFNLKLLTQKIPLYPILSHEYPTPAKRPHYSVLDKASIYQALEITPIHWQAQLISMLEELQ